jgi:ferric enterobactin receptor
LIIRYLSKNSVKLKKKFRQEGRSFSASWAYATEQSQDANTNQQNINYLPQLYFQNKGNTKNNTHTVALDYEQPNRRKPDNVWRVGAKAIQRQVITDNIYALHDDSSQTFVPNAALSSQMDYVQQTAAIYTEYSHKAGKWGFKGGLRGEYTWVDAQFLNNNTQAKQQYLNLLPTLSANYALSTERNLTWSYRKGISRPWVRYLNPFINSNNPQFLYQGNPELLPELTHKLEISYNQSKKGKNLSISLAQNIRQQVISDIVTMDSLAIALQTYNNSGSLYSSSLSVAYSAMLFKKLNISLSTTVSHNTLNGTIGTTAVRNSGVVMSANGNINYNIGKGWKTGGYGYFRSGDIDLQGNNLPYFSYSIRVSKSLWKDNLTLSLSANMPFHQNVKYGSMQHSPDFDIENTTSRRTRNFSIRVNYKFGKLKEAVSRKKGIQNDDLKTGGQ